MIVTVCSVPVGGRTQFPDQWSRKHLHDLEDKVFAGLSICQRLFRVEGTSLILRNFSRHAYRAAHERKDDDIKRDYQPPLYMPAVLSIFEAGLT